LRRDLGVFLMADDQAPSLGSIWQHCRRGTRYTVLHIGTLQTSEEPGLDDELCVIYQNISHYAVWVRPLTEFMDGRFIEIDP
jgi:hypothetical protein